MPRQKQRMWATQSGSKEIMTVGSRNGTQSIQLAAFTEGCCSQIHTNTTNVPQNGTYRAKHMWENEW